MQDEFYLIPCPPRHRNHDLLMRRQIMLHVIALYEAIVRKLPLQQGLSQHSEFRLLTAFPSGLPSAV
jgi:hypothetical protein